MRFFLSLLIPALMIATPAVAQEPDRRIPVETNGKGPDIDQSKLPKVEKIGDTRFRMGLIEFDAKSKEIFIPSTVNKREGGPIEYLLVHEQGPIHEAILVTKASPLHLQIVTKLLKHKSGFGNVFDPILAVEEQAGTDKDNGVEFSLLARWTPRDKPDSKEKEQDLSAWLIDGESGNPPANEPWTLTGSYSRNGTYAADVDGFFAAVYLQPAAVLNMTREGSHIDERWGANAKNIPEIGQSVLVVLKPAGD